MERRESEMSTREMEKTCDRNDQRIGSNGRWKHTLSKKCNKFLSEPAQNSMRARIEFYSNDLPNGLRKPTTNTMLTAFRIYAFRMVFIHAPQTSFDIIIFSIWFSRAERILAHTSSSRIYARHADTFLLFVLFFIAAPPRMAIRCYRETRSALFYVYRSVFYDV